MGDAYGATVLAAGQTINSFTTFLPRLSEIRKANMDTDRDIVGDVRLGEVAATALALGVGSIASSLSGSPVPLYAAAFMIGLLIVVYESALRGDDLFSPKVVTSHA